MILKEKSASLCRLIREKSFAVCCGLAPVALLIVFLFTFKFGFNVIVDGEIIGTAKSRDYVYNLIDSINEDFAPYFSGDEPITVKPVTTPKLVFKGRFTPESELEEKIKSTCPYLKNAYSIKSGGATVAAFYSAADRKKAYNGFLAKYADVRSDDSYEVLDDVEFAYGLVPYGMVKNVENGIKLLDSTKSVNTTVKTDADTHLEDILRKYNLTSEEFALQNPNYSEGKKQIIKISSEVPVIRVATTESTSEERVLRYRTRSVDDDTAYEGESTVKSEGCDGVKVTDKKIYKLNGRTLAEVAVGEKVTEPVDEILLVGTKQYTKGDATGTFERPYGGNLSSRFGERGGRNHNGVDICGKVGDDITASDGGEVIYADWEEGYGYVVKIDHKNGYITFYAHCNELYVTKGQKVSKGDVIAALGNTGRSTGPHVHFEVRDSSSGKALNPLEFIEN